MGGPQQICITSIKLTLNKQQQLIHLIMESQNLQQDECEAPEPEDYTYDDYELGYDDYMYDQSLSMQNQPPISFLKMSDLPQKIMEETQKWTSITGLPKEWILMLYFFRDFTAERINEVIDCNFTGRRIIHYVADYEPNLYFGTCGVCCQEKAVYSNPCAHSFCLDCWTSHLKRKLEESQLFPFCQEDGCPHRMNYKLMGLFFEEDTQLKNRFQRLLCYKYCQKNPRVRLCPLNRCEKVLFINIMTDSKVVCQCGTNICKKCGFIHFPLTCSDLSNWKMMIVTNENQWINIDVMQKCPMCKQPIIKTYGCIHMTCRCGHQFCWICLKVWAGHSIYQNCAISQKEHEKTLKRQQQKRFMDINEYNYRFEEAKSETERLTHLVKLLSGQGKDLMHLDCSKLQFLYLEVVGLQEIRQFAIKIWELQIYVCIYNFFQNQHSELMIQRLKPLSNFASRIDDFIRIMIREKARDVQLLQKQTQIRIEDVGGIFEEIKKWFSQEMNRFFTEFEISRALYAQFQSGEVLHTLKSMAKQQEDRLLHKMQSQEYQDWKYQQPMVILDYNVWRQQHMQHQVGSGNNQRMDQGQITFVEQGRYTQESQNMLTYLQTVQAKTRYDKMYGY